MPELTQSATTDWLEHVDQTEGWLSLDEARELHAIASTIDKGVIVEVGSYRGRSAVALADGAPVGTPVYAVDPHALLVESDELTYGPEDRAAFFRAMLRSEAYRRVSLINLSSEIITPGWSEPVGFLWIDGDHTHEGVRRDWACWQPHLLPGAVVAFDDAHDPNVGPYHLINELVDAGVLVHRKNVGKVRTLTFPGAERA